jgi:hypothetical protein
VSSALSWQDSPVLKQDNVRQLLLRGSEFQGLARLLPQWPGVCAPPECPCRAAYELVERDEASGGDGAGVSVRLELRSQRVLLWFNPLAGPSGTLFWSGSLLV